MKKLSLILLALVAIFASCKKDSISHEDEFEQSLRSWQSFKSSSNNSYSYIVYTGSVFGGYTETKITVQNGKVTGRNYVVGGYAPGSTTVQVMDQWSETAATLNTHQAGAPTITLDDIYEKARTEYLTADRKKNSVYFEVNNEGLISSAGYVPEGCMDDCFYGVHIKSITRL